MNFPTYIYIKKYNNLKNIYGKNLDYFNLIVLNLPENVVICLNESISQNGIPPQITKKECHTFSCLDNWKSKKNDIGEDK